MTAIKVIQRLLEDEPIAGAGRHLARPGLQAATDIVQIQLADDPLDKIPIPEASVHLPRRGSVWVATFTGQDGQVWKSTGLKDREEALLVARRWEAEARAERAKLGRSSRKLVWRVRHGVGFTEKEVAQLMHISVRAVRLIEKRAIQKLLNYPLLRELWRDYSAGDLDEEDLRLTAAEIAALFSLAWNEEELRLIEKVLRIAQA